MQRSQEIELIDYLDKSLSQEQMRELENALQTQPLLAKEFEFIQIAVESIRISALNEQVARIGSAWHATQRETQNKPGSRIRALFIRPMAAAAILLIVVMASALYEYSTATGSSCFADHFERFELRNNRGNQSESALDAAYNHKDWNAVIQQFNAATSKDNRDWFLTGMANLELKEYKEAILKFDYVVSQNSQTHMNYFADESEFYLAMAYLANNQSAKALPIIDKIKADPNHTYYEKAKSFSGIQFQILRLKSSK